MNIFFTTSGLSKIHDLPIFFYFVFLFPWQYRGLHNFQDFFWGCVNIDKVYVNKQGCDIFDLYIFLRAINNAFIK